MEREVSVVGKKFFGSVLAVLIIVSAFVGIFGITIADNSGEGNQSAEPMDVEYNYISHIFTVADVIFFSYKDGTMVALYDSSGTLIWNNNGNPLDKGEHAHVAVPRGVYTACGSEKFAVLTGDPITRYVVGYYAMDQNGYGASTELYTWVPHIYGHCSFIVFAYQNNTQVTVEYTDTGIDIATFTLNKGEHWQIETLDAEWLHIIASKPVSALTCYDQGYFVPSANGKWSGTEFYTYVSDIWGWPQDLTVIAYNDGTSVTIKDSDTGTVIWSGTLDSGEAHVESFPNGADKFFTITSSKTVTVSVQPWVSMSCCYHQGAYVADSTGTLIGTDLIGSTLNGGYLYILAYKDNTNVVIYNSQTGDFVASYTLDEGEYVEANPGNGLWRIISNYPVSAYSGWDLWNADFAPVEFREITAVNVNISTDKDTYSPYEEVIISAKVIDADGNPLYPLKKANFKVFVDGTEVNIEDFEIVSCTEYKLKIKAPEVPGDHIIEVNVYTVVGNGYDSQTIIVSPIDSDGDGLFDYEEDRDHDGIVDPDETDPNNPDTDGDGINDKDDLYPWLTTNRKALVIGFTEYDYVIPFLNPPKLDPYWPREAARNFEKLGFSVDAHIDEDNDDGDVITYSEVSQIIKNFKNSLESDDVAIVFISSHGNEISGWYLLCYGNDIYPEDKWPWTVTGQLDDIGVYLDFLWLSTCHSWAYRDKISKLGAGGVIFFGNDGVGWSQDCDAFYSAIAGDCYYTTVKLNKIPDIQNNPGIESVQIISINEKEGSALIKICCKKQRYVESTIDDVNIPNGKDSEGNDIIRNLKMLDKYPGHMDLMNPLLTHKSPVVHMFEPEDPIQIQNETFASVNYTIWDSDGDGVNDTVTVSWDANTVLPQDNVTVIADVSNSSRRIVKSFVYGPYTIYRNSSENSSFNFYSTNTDTYNIRLMLYNSSLKPVDVAFITNLSLNAGTGGPGGDEEFTSIWFNTSDSNGDGVDDTIKVSWNVNTTLSQENVSVLVTVRGNVFKYGPYTIYTSLPNKGEIEFYAGETGVYEISLYLIDSNSELEDSGSLEVPLGISSFTDSYADHGVDTDSDGKYNYLTVDVEVNVTVAGNYILRGSLYDLDGNHILTISNSTFLSKGLKIVRLNFDGETLYKSGIDGPYELRYLTLYKDGTFIGHRNRPYTTSAYNHTEFQPPAVIFVNFSDYGIDTNGNGLYEYLRIDVNVNVTIAGNYTIIGYLFDENGNFVVATTNSSYLNRDLQTVRLDFNGSIISYKGRNGPYHLTINAYKNNSPINMRKEMYITNAYLCTQFETSPVILDWSLSMPLEVLLGQMFNVTMVITNPSNRILYDLQASLILPPEFDTMDPSIINIGNLEPGQSKEIEWTLKGINPGYGEIEVNVTSPDIQNISIRKGVIVTHFPLLLETDKKAYDQGDNVIITTTLTNNNPEISYVDLTIDIIVQGTGVNETYSIPIDYIRGLETRNFALTWDTTGQPVGSYIVMAKILEDATLLNETSISFEVLGLDNTPPTTNKTVGNPKYGINGEWVSLSTPIWLNASDDMAGVKSIHYEIWWDQDKDGTIDIQVMNVTVYDGDANDLDPTLGSVSVKFNFTKQCLHELRWYSVDKVGNVENMTNQIHYVDNNPPVTSISYGSPYYTNGTEEWITTSTSIYLNATDLPECGCGVNHTYYRINNGTWIEYTGPFTINEECKHTIEWYSVDYLGNTEQVHSTVVNVDSSPPVTNSSIGKPYYKDERGEWITSDTSIYLNSTDYPEDCACGVREIYYSYDNGRTWFKVNGNKTSFYIPEECAHVVKWYAVDNLGNEEEIHERILNVDNSPPETTLVIEGHYSGSGTPDDPYRIAITPETKIYLNATDKPECGAVGVRNTYFRIRADGLITKWMSLKELEEKGNDIKLAIPKSIIDKGGPFYLDYYSDDLLGNREDIKTTVFYLQKMHYHLGYKGFI